MTKFHLHTSKYLQGSFVPRAVNLAFVFQVNCPGCFIYGMPIVHTLFEQHQNEIGFLSIATAFEDFELNTEENTIIFLNSMKLIGETEKYFSANPQLKEHLTPLKMAVAFDKLSPAIHFLNDEKLNIICQKIEDFKSWDVTTKQLVRNKIRSYYSQFVLLPETFTLNQMRGTPSFIIFDENFTILNSFFGHQKMETLHQKLIEYKTRSK